MLDDGRHLFMRLGNDGVEVCGDVPCVPLCRIGAASYVEGGCRMDGIHRFRSDALKLARCFTEPVVGSCIGAQLGLQGLNPDEGICLGGCHAVASALEALLDLPLDTQIAGFRSAHGSPSFSLRSAIGLIPAHL